MLENAQEIKIAIKREMQMNLLEAKPHLYTYTFIITSRF